ncbi:MAG: zinc ribbon domain-containing protein [Gemmataceae bacterium]
MKRSLSGSPRILDGQSVDALSRDAILGFMKCTQCQSAIAPEQKNCPSCGKPQKPRRKKRSEAESEALSFEAQAILQRAKYEYHRVLWGLIPGVGLLWGPWVCWIVYCLQAEPEAKPSLAFLRSIFGLALFITVSQWFGLVFLLLAIWMG